MRRIKIIWLGLRRARGQRKRKAARKAERVGKVEDMRDVVAKFTAMVEEVQGYLSLPCVCDRSSIKALEASIARCTPCHAATVFDETLEHAEGVVDYMRQMAANHPVVVVAPTEEGSNVVKFQPLGRKPQPTAIWK